MKVYHPLFESSFSFDETEVAVLVVENQREFTKLVIELSEQIKGYDGGFVFSRNGVPFSPAKEIDLIIDPLSLDCNKKKLLTRLYTEISELAVSEDHYISTVEMQGFISQYLQKLTHTVSFPLVYNEELPVQAILKAADVSFDLEAYDFMECLINYFSIMQEYCKIFCFVLVNLKSWLCADDLQKLYKDAANRKYALLLLENKLCDVKLPYEKFRIIDDDLCEVL